jgi:hypothetical protein
MAFVQRWAVRTDDLLQSFNQFLPHVVHFSGQGNASGELVLLDRESKPRSIKRPALIRLFETLKDNIRLVVLNASHSHAQAIALTKYIDCAIGMRGPVSESAAIIFAAAFYRGLAFGRSILSAFEQGRTALMLEDSQSDAVPELVVKSGADASCITLIKG